ncbi:MAG: hypothetical protein ACPG4X_21080 [Pikeienuella sp.]
MIDAKEFGEQLAGIVKSQTAPLISRIENLEKALAEQPEPVVVDEKSIAELVIVEITPEIERVKALKAPDLPDIPSAPELPDIGAMVDEAVKSAVEALPAPKDGKSVTVEEVMPDLVGHVDKFLADIPGPERGADGIGLAGAFIDRDGGLTLTMTNGETKNLGPIVGKDGETGVGFDDLDIVHDGEREFTLRFQRGAKIVEKTLTIPAMLDRGVFSEGKQYDQGDVVSFGGSMWVAQKGTDERPGTGDGWRLSVKKGRDGKNGEIKEPVKPEPVKVS